MKTTKLINYLLLSVIVLSITAAHSIGAPTKFGKIDIENLKKNSCPIDSNAHAYYIFDIGESEFKYNTANGDEGFQIVFTRHFRIKILDNQGFSFGNIKIPLYQSNSGEENIGTLKAYTYNLGKGKVEKEKLDRKDVLYEQTSENWETQKFAMPNIKAGSIIEIEYTITSDFLFNLQEWYFQKSIPVIHSEYKVCIPEYFNYNQTETGYFPVNREVGSRPNSVTFNSMIRSTNNRVTSSKSSSSTINYIENTYHFRADNITPFPKEKYLKTEDNYLSKITFELQSTRFPNSPLKYYTTSWEEIDKNLNDSEYFGKTLSRNNHLKDEIALLKSSGEIDEALLNSAFNHIKKKISWNGKRTKYVEFSLSKAYKNGEGNCADINLNLVALLQELGFNSYPIILSTQDNGIIHPAHPSLSSFNYVIALVELNGKNYLMDATSPISTINLIPTRCLNDKGRIIGDVAEKWINLMDYKSYTVKATYQITIDSTLILNGAIKKRLDDYGAYNYKVKLEETNDALAFISKDEGKNLGVEVTDIEVEGLENQGKSLNIKYKFTEGKMLNNAGGMIYFTPVLDPFFSENPFKLEKREFPVEFNHPYQFLNIYNYFLPENMEVTELPKPIAVTLPENNGMFYYNIQQIANILTITSTMRINKSLFLPNEYEYLKSFFQHIIDKQNELVVLKKI